MISIQIFIFVLLIFQSVSLSLGFVSINAFAKTKTSKPISTAVPTPPKKINLDPVFVDLYLLVDASASIEDNKKRCRNATMELYPPKGKTCWQLFSNFADELQKGVAALADGYALNPEDAGMRLSLYTFSCHLGNPRKTILIDGPSGDINKITSAFDDLENMVPEGGTCPSDGIKYIRKSIQRQIESGGNRFSGVVLLTDGLIDIEKNQRQKSMNEAHDLLALQDTLLFIVSVNSKPSDLEQQQQMFLDLANGDGSKTFPVEKEESLRYILDILAASLGNNFIASYDYANQLKEAIPYGGNGINQICLGAPAKVKLTGRSIKYLSHETMRCNFTLSLIPSGSIADGERQFLSDAVLDPATGYRSCELPPLFMKAYASKIVLQLNVLDAEGFRLLGPQIVLPALNLISCATSSHQTTANRCVIGGNNAITTFSGPSVTYALPRLSPTSSFPYPLVCVFSRVGMKITRLATVSPENQRDIICSLDSEDDLKTLLEAKIFPNPITSVGLAVADMNWFSIERLLNPLGDLPIGLIQLLTISNSAAYPDAVSNGCIAFSGLSDSSSCWTGLNDDSKGPFAYFSGKSISLLNEYSTLYKNNGNFALQCSFSKTGIAPKTSIAVLTLDDKSQPIVKCVIPFTFLQTSNGNDVTNNFKVALYVSQTPSGSSTLLSNNPSQGFDTSILVKSCFTISYDSVSCMGEEHEFNVTGVGVSQIPSNVDLVCQFDDSVNGVSVKVSAKKYGSKTITCNEPASVGQYSGLFFDTLTLRDKSSSGKIYFMVNNISFGLDLCLDLGIKNFPNGNNFCWGYEIDENNDSAPSVVVSGSSTKYLASSEEKISIIFSDASIFQDYTITPRFQGSNTVGGEYIATFPVSITKRPVGEVALTVKLIVGTRTQATYQLPINVLGCSAFEQIYTPSVANENVGDAECWPFCCYRNAVEVYIKGPNYEAFIDESKAQCQFSKFNEDGTSVVVATSKISSNGLSAAKCSAPGWTPFQNTENPEGVYDLISVVIQATQTTPEYEVIRSSVMAAKQLCTHVSYEKTLSWGQSLDVSLRGTSLFSFALWGSRDKVNWLNSIKCSLVDVTSKSYKVENLPITWDKFTGTLTCKRPGMFSLDEMKTTALRIISQKPVAPSSFRRGLQIQPSVVLVDDMVLDVDLQNPFTFDSASASCLSNGKNIAKVVVAGADVDFGSFKCTFYDESGDNQFTTGIDYRISSDGIMTCSITIPTFKSVSNYTVSFEPDESIGEIEIASGSLDISSSCFLPSNSPTLQPTVPRTDSPTAPTLGEITGSPTSLQTSTPTIKTENITLSPTFIAVQVVQENKTIPPTSRQNDFSALYIIIGVLFALLFLFAMIIMFVVMKKRRRTKSDEAVESPQENSNEERRIELKALLTSNKEEEEHVAIIPTSSNPADTFKVGDRVEVLGEGRERSSNDDDNSILINRNENWYKGTVVAIETSKQNNDNTRYTVEYDSEVFRPGQNEGISASQIRYMKTDYKVNSIVDCLSKDTENWEKGRIVEILPNDEYTIVLSTPDRHTGEYITENNVVGETQIKEHKPKYAAGDIIEAFVDNKWKRAVVDNVVGSDLYEISIDKDDQEIYHALRSALSTSLLEPNAGIGDDDEKDRKFLLATKNLRKLQFKVGDQVEIPKGTSWVIGEITKVQGDYTYEVNVLPRTEHAFLERNVSVKALRTRRKVYYKSVGDVVEVLQDDQVTWKRGKIIDCLGPDLYHISYEAEKRRLTIESEESNHLDQSLEKEPWNEIHISRIRSPVYRVGDYVQAKTLDGWFGKGTWNDAIITNVNDDGSCNVEFIDPSNGTLDNVGKENIRYV